MPIVLTAMLTALGKVLLSMFTALFTEKFLKIAIVSGLEKIASKTQSELDDKLLAAAKEAWGMDEKKGEPNAK
jgi:hypothetical protein